MIISRPKSSALFSLTIFIIISLALAYAGISRPIETGVWKWYNYIAVYIFGPLAMILSFRIMYNFKVLYISKAQVEAWFPFRFFRKKYKLEELEFWNEETVKTGKTLFRELRMKFRNKTIKISNQENSSYDKIFKYLSTKAKTKKND